ncbi:MAG: hypothetical protein ABEJ92_01600 [Halobacteriales archaeon]
MADTKEGRENQARAEERRQRQRRLEEALERADEAEPPADEPELTVADLDDALEGHDFPATTAELIEAYGDYVVDTDQGWRVVSDVLAGMDERTFETADEVRRQLLD